MKRVLILLSLIALTFTSCSNDDSNSNTVPTTSSFKWTENGGAEITADSAYYESAFKTIKAYKNINDAANSKFVEINLTAGTVGSYDVTTGNAIALLASNSLFSATSGTINITESTSNTMTGSFDGSSSTGNTTAIEGTFNAIEIR